MKPANSRRSAFTLVELLVVMAIMALGLSVFLGLNYRQRESFRWRTSLRELKVFLKLARSYAILERRPNSCYYDPAKRSFSESLRRRRVRLPPGVELVLDEKRKAELEQLVDGREPAAAEEKKQKARLRLAIFYADGGAGGEPLQLRCGRRRARLEINSLTGAVRVVEEAADDTGS